MLTVNFERAADQTFCFQILSLWLLLLATFRLTRKLYEALVHRDIALVILLRLFYRSSLIRSGWAPQISALRHLRLYGDLSILFVLTP